MTDMIDRKVVIDEINRLINEKHHIKIGTSDFRDGVIDGYARVLSKVKILPPSQPKGKWLEKNVARIDEDLDDSAVINEWQSARCSVCDKYHTTPYMYYFDNFNFCPNCGAKMDKNQ